MACGYFPCKSGLLAVALGVILSLQIADAQTTTIVPSLPVPGWGIALLVLMSLFLGGILVCLCCAPVCCRNTGIDASGGSSTFMSKLAFWK